MLELKFNLYISKIVSKEQEKQFPVKGACCFYTGPSLLASTHMVAYNFL